MVSWVVLEADLPRDGIAAPEEEPLLANRSGGAGRPGGSCGFLSNGIDGLPGKSGLSRSCGRSGRAGRVLVDEKRSTVELFGARSFSSFGLCSGVEMELGIPPVFFRDGIVCTGGKGGGLSSLRLAGGNSGGPFSNFALPLVFLTFGELGGII